VDPGSLLSSAIVSKVGSSPPYVPLVEANLVGDLCGAWSGRSRTGCAPATQGFDPRRQVAAPPPCKPAPIPVCL